MDVSGLVLAGGRSARLGTDKRAVWLDGVTLLDRALGLLAGLSDDVMVAAPPDALTAGRTVRIIPDAMPGHGPMAGILAGLTQGRHKRVLVIPVDMPMLTATFLRFLAGVDPDAAVTVPAWSAGLEPLVAVYHAACASAIAEFLAQGSAAVHAFINSTALRVHRVEEQDIRRYGEPSDLFHNINTPEDLTRLEAILRRMRSGGGPRSP